MAKTFRFPWLTAVAAAGLSLLAACSDEPDPAGPEEPVPSGPVKFANDLLNGGLVYVAEYSGGAGFKIPFKTNKPVKFRVLNDSPFSVEAVSEGDGNYLSGQARGAFDGKAHVLVMRAENENDARDFRHFLVVVVNSDASLRRAGSRSPSSNMTKAYGDIMGMGTQCFELMGNTKRAVLQSSLIPIEDQNLVTSQVLDLTEMFEVSGESFKSTMDSWSANIGISFRGLGKNKGEWGKFSGSFNFGFDHNVSTSDDFEFYLNVYKVIRGEIAYNMKEFENMAVSDTKEAPETFLSYVSAGFIRDVMEVENEKLDTIGFFDTWGTDMISQAQLGGFKVYMYGRETNTYERSIGFDVSAELKRLKTTEVSSDRDWLDLYMLKNSPYLGGSAGLSYMSDDYFEATRSTSVSLAVGGNPSLGNDPDRWIGGFETVDENVKWQPISYRRHSDSAAPTDEVWCLYPIEDMAANVLNAVENILSKETLGKQDSMILENARANIVSLGKAKPGYVSRFVTNPEPASRLVLCDVMMKYDPEKQKSGKPEPFVGNDPRDPSKKRVYYPMMANMYFDKGRAVEHQRGHAIDTNVDCFIVAAEAGSHYWYYALAHDNDCDGIVDIHFYDHDEQFYQQRGDDAHMGSGIGNYWKSVRVRFFDKNVHSSDQKITAFGIYDDHREVNNIIASTGGSELPLNATESEFNAWCKFWEGYQQHHDWPKYAFYHGGASIPHGIYPRFTTKTLPIDNIRKVTHPEKY